MLFIIIIVFSGRIVDREKERNMLRIIYLVM